MNPPRSLGVPVFLAVLAGAALFAHAPALSQGAAPKHAGVAQAEQTGSARKDPGIVDSYLISAFRDMGLRWSLQHTLEEGIAPLPAGEARAALAEELAGEYLRDGRASEALALLVSNPRTAVIWDGNSWGPGTSNGSDRTAWNGPYGFALGVALLNAGYPEQALSTLADLDTTDAALAECRDGVALVAGMAARRARDFARATSELERAAEIGETGALRASAERELVWTLLEAGNVEAARRRAIDGGSLARLGAPELVLLLAERVEASGRVADADDLYDRACDDLIGTAAAVKAFTALAARRAGGADSAGAAFYLRGVEIAQKGAAWDEAIRLARLAATAPGAGEPQRERARYQEGLALYNSGRYEDCVAALEKIRRSKPSWEVARDALIYLGRAERRRGRMDASRRYYERFLVEFREDPFAEEVLWDLAWRDLKEGKTARALSRLREMGRRFPWGKRRPEALFREALAHWDLGDKGECAKDLDRLMRLGPDPSLAAQTLYFRARVARAQGHKKLSAAIEDSLVANYPDTFYATYVGAMGGGPERAWWEAADEAPDLADRAVSAYRPLDEAAAARRWIGSQAAAADTLESSRPLRRAALFARAGVNDLLAAELRRVEAETATTAPWRDFLMARLYRRYGFHHLSLSAGSRFANAGKMPRPVEVTRLLFPPAHLDLAARAAREAGLDPRLLLAIAREESWFEEGAVSHAGAVGLMQILPGTGRSLARALGQPDSEAVRLTDPWVSLRLGARYMNSLLTEFDGSLILAAAAYNGGETNAHEWQAHYRAEDPPLSIEWIAFTETRGYVKKILRSLWVYQAAYPTASEADSAATR